MYNLLSILPQVGLGSFFLRYIPGLLHQILLEMGISEDMYNPVRNLSLSFLIIFTVFHPWINLQKYDILSNSLLMRWHFVIMLVGSSCMCLYACNNTSSMKRYVSFSKTCLQRLHIWPNLVPLHTGLWHQDYCLNMNIILL